MTQSSSNRQPFSVAFVTLGCAKNVVDSEKAMGALVRQGFAVSLDPAEADIVVVNTCGFIEAAREESVEEILDTAELKHTGRMRALVVAGCLPVRYLEELQAELPEVDHFLGLVEPEGVLDLCCRLAAGWGRIPDGGTPQDRYITAARLLTTPRHYAYMKIAEGCSNPCTFCSIPLMRGRTRSIAPDELVAEAGELVGGGVRELILVAQDTTHYGADLAPASGGGSVRLAGLIRRLGAEVEGLEWLRLMYTYPSRVTGDLLDAMAGTPQVVPYLDIPVQHGSERILKAMGRPMGRQALLELLASIRERIPAVALRTSIIVGFPGETEADFLETLDLVEQVRFERLGVFTYSREEGTPACEMEGQVPAEEMERRCEELLRLQRGIVAEHNNSLQGKVVEVLVEEELEDLPPFSFLGRTPWDAPEVDQEIYLELPGGGPTAEGSVAAAPARRPRPGELVSAEVVGAIDFDLEGVLVTEPPR